MFYFELQDKEGKASTSQSTKPTDGGGSTVENSKGKGAGSNANYGAAAASASGSEKVCLMVRLVLYDNDN